MTKKELLEKLADSSDETEIEIGVMFLNKQTGASEGIMFAVEEVMDGGMHVNVAITITEDDIPRIMAESAEEFHQRIDKLLS